jgi:hypothetical protein
MLMSTHTTDKSPRHPAWLPEAYYYHLWEGFQGSNLILYDPQAKKAENLGIPVPHESIYGGVYDRKHHAFYFSGYFRGHLYRYDLETKRIDDLGQVTEFGSFRFLTGPDNHIYSASRSGYFYRVNVDKGKIEDLNIRFPGTASRSTSFHRQLNFGVNGPDGRMYLGVVFEDNLLVYDPKTNKLDKCGSYKPSTAYSAPVYDTIAGMDFDERGCLWYGYLMFDKNVQNIGTRLMKWDVLSGGKPEHIGLFGTPERLVGCISELFIRNGVLYAADTNHANDAPGIISADLEVMGSNIDKPREMCRDPYAYFYVKNGEEVYPGHDFYKDTEKYIKFMVDYDEYNSFKSQNNFSIKARDIHFIRLWRELPLEESAVRKLFWDDSGVLHGICGNSKLYSFFISDDRMSIICPDNIDAEHTVQTMKTMLPDTEYSLNTLNYPSYPGRQYLAKPSAWAEWNNNRFIVGTLDGMLAIAGKDGVFSLGPAAPNGPVHCITTNTAKTVAFGVAGDEQDLGMVFSYDDDNGMCWLGRVFATEPHEPGIGASCELSCCALSPDGSTLAIGSKDRMGCIYMYKLA